MTLIFSFFTGDGFDDHETVIDGTYLEVEPVMTSGKQMLATTVPF